MLHERFGKKVSVALCGPVGEYGGLIAGIGMSDSERRPSRIAARGGVGAVMGSKKVKAVIVDMDKMPALHDRKKVLADIRTYSRKLRADPVVRDTYQAIGTMAMADYTNYVGGLPTRNFSSGQQVDIDVEPLTMGGDYIRDQNVARGGKHTHACMPGCVIQCSNVYADADGKEVVSPVEYETLCLLGTNCGISDPDLLAGHNYIANDLGIDTIEVGATLALLMEAGLAEFGDARFMTEALMEIREGTENGRLWAQGAARVGDYYGLKRVPVVKKQAISAYDPRVIEVTGLSMMSSAQGADHTTGNVPRVKSREKELDELLDISLDAQVACAATDSLGLCVFGRSVTNENTDFLADAVNNALGTELKQTFFAEIGRETLKLEAEFNRLAGFTAEDDELPTFFYEEPLHPTNNVARFHGHEVHNIFQRLD
jgi:aldehyde:ferredoxin oxidoreductase